MFSERGGFRPPEENPQEATPGEIDTMLEGSLRENEPTIADMVREELDKMNEESLMGGRIRPKDFVLQTMSAIRVNPENKAFADDLNQTIRKRSEKTGLPDEKIMEGMADVVGLWLQSQLAEMKKSDIKLASIPQTLNDGLAAQITAQVEKMKSLTMTTEEKAATAASKREQYEALKSKKAD